MFAVLTAGCSLMLPKTLLIDKAAIVTEVNNKLPMQFGPLTIGQPLIDFIGQRQCVQIQLDIAGQLLGNRFTIPVSTCSGIHFDQEAQAFFLEPEFDQLQTPWNDPGAEKPLAGDLSSLAKKTLRMWAQKHPIYVIPKDKLVRYGYRVSIYKVTIVDQGILCELH